MWFGHWCIKSRKAAWNQMRIYKICWLPLRWEPWNIYFTPIKIQTKATRDSRDLEWCLSNQGLQHTRWWQRFFSKKCFNIQKAITRNIPQNPPTLRSKFNFFRKEWLQSEKSSSLFHPLWIFYQDSKAFLTTSRTTELSKLRGIDDLTVVVHWIWQYGQS